MFYISSELFSLLTFSEQKRFCQDNLKLFTPSFGEDIIFFPFVSFFDLWEQVLWQVGNTFL